MVARVPNPSPELACVVFSLRAQPELAEAARSAQEQDVPVELVVVNSGGGDAAGVLARAGVGGVPVVELGAPALPGAARNAGVRATNAPYVAFLEADCIAEPGWAAARLAAHRAGAGAVASVMTCAPPARAASYASLLLLHNRRLPDTPPERRLHYGLSFRRSLLDDAGPFREDVRAGEDTDLRERINGSATIVWAPDVRTAHRYPSGARALLADQFARGARRARSAPGSARGVARNALVDIGACVRAARDAPDPHERRRRTGALPLLPAGAAAYAVGALLAEVRR
jgi:glycosyltransferase involved in cell wall biosynthesis